MIKFTRFEIENLVQSDSGFGDLSTDLLSEHSQKTALLEIKTRSDICISSLDVIQEISKIYDLEFLSDFKNSQIATTGSVIAKIKGEFGTLHAVYKVMQNLLEYSCGISTASAKMSNLAKSINPKCEILVTRKSFPFAKKLCLKAAVEGGAKIHRLGVSDSVLFFENHLVAFRDKSEFLAKILEFKAKFCEKKILAECDNIDFGKELLKNGIDGVQCDKMQISEIANLVKFKNENFPNAIVLAAGGINLNNTKDYATTLCDGLVTSFIFRQTADLGAKIIL